MYICVCFIRKVSNIQHGVRIEAVATSLQEGEATDQIQQIPAYFQASWTFLQENCNSSRGIYILKGREEDRPVQSAIVSRIFRAVPHSETTFYSSRKALQAPCVQLPMLPSILPGKKLHSMWQWNPASPCGVPRVAENYLEVGIYTG